MIFKQSLRGSLALLGSAVFVPIAVATPGIPGVLRWSGGLFFGACFLIGVILLMPGSTYLKATADALEYRRFYYQRLKLPKTAIARFVGVQEHILGLDYAESYRGPRTLRNARTIVGVDAILIVSGEMHSTAIADRLNAWLRDGH